MRTIYSEKLKLSNKLLGFHAFFKLSLILLLFVVLSSTIWMKEKYLNYVKASIYSQIFLLLVLLIQILVLNNPKFFDVCEPYIEYIYLICSILELALIIMELFAMKKNLNIFIIIFHDCPYYRTFNEIIDNQYKRSCLYYNNMTTFENNYNYQYICYYNSEEEYHNSFCDGFFCSKSQIKNLIKNNGIKCKISDNKNILIFNEDNPYYKQEDKLIVKYIGNLYICTRKNKIEKNNDILNDSCPDDNPLKKNIIYIYVDFILHFILDFLFVYEFILIININKLYTKIKRELHLGNLNSQQSNAEINNMNPSRSQSEEYTENKQTFNTENQNRERVESNSHQHKDSTQTIIIENTKNQQTKQNDKLFVINEEELNDKESTKNINIPNLKTKIKYKKINPKIVEQQLHNFMKPSDINVHLSSDIGKKKNNPNKEDKNSSLEKNNTFFKDNKEENRKILELFINNNNNNKHRKKIIKIKTYDLIIDDHSSIEKNNNENELENETEKVNTTKSQCLVNINNKNDQSPSVNRHRNIYLNCISTEKKTNINSCIKKGKSTIEDEENNINIKINDVGIKQEKKNLNDIRLNARLCSKKINNFYEEYGKNKENKYKEIKEQESKELLTSYNNFDEDKKDIDKIEKKEKNNELNQKKIKTLAQIVKIQSELFMEDDLNENEVKFQIKSDNCSGTEKRIVNPDLITNVNKLNKN